MRLCQRVVTVDDIYSTVYYVDLCPFPHLKYGIHQVVAKDQLTKFISTTARMYIFKRDNHGLVLGKVWMLDDQVYINNILLIYWIASVCIPE